MSDRTPHLLSAFALVVVQHPDGRFLLVHETQQRGWWLPGGRVEKGESFQTAAIRETKEEGGMDITLEGILRVEFSPSSSGNRMRVIFLGRPADAAAPVKTVADSESLESRWVTMEDINGDYKKLLRGFEPAIWFDYVAKGGTVYPMSLLTRENEPPPRPAAAESSATSGGGEEAEKKPPPRLAR